MRVHLRGVVIAVVVLLSLVVIVSVFNAYDSKPTRGRTGRQAGRQNRNLATSDDDDDDDDDDEEEEADASPRGRKNSPKARSRNLPRSSLRLTDTRAGGPRGPGARAGGPRAGRAGPRAAEDSDGAATRPMPRGRVGGPRARQQQLEDEDSEDTDTGGPRARGGPGPRGGAARGGPRAGGAEGRPAGGPKKGRKKASEDEDGEGKSETATRKPKKKKEPAYPDWWKTSYPRSAVYGKDKEFVGDQPLFPECPVFEKDSPKMQRFGYVEPQNYMANSKNPCWFEFNGKKDLLKCVPYFYVAGVAKSGTADLLTRVRNHPQVISGSTIAYHWWDRQRYGAPATLKYTKEARRPQDPMPLKDYAKQVVETGGKNVTRELLYHGKSNIIFGDGSPTYLVENTQWTVFEGNQGCNEPRILPATFIRHMFPDSRIILMLRHPVVRLYSRFLANVPPVPEFANRTASLFHTFCVQAVQIYQECFARASIRQCAYNSTLFSNAVVRLSEGMYPIFLEDWFRIFPREQLLIFRFEEYVSDIQGSVAKVFDFLGLEPLDPYAMMKISEIPVARKGKTVEQAGHMLPETVHLLNEFYAPFLARLAYMLDDEKWLFNDVTIMTSQVIVSSGPTAYVPPGQQGHLGQTMPTQTEATTKAEPGGEKPAETKPEQVEPDAADELAADDVDVDEEDDNDDEDDDDDDENEAEETDVENDV